MSLSTFPVKKVYKAVDPRVDFYEQPLYCIGESGAEVSYRQFPATTFSNTNIIIPTTQSPDIAIVSKVFMRIRFRVEITGTPSAPGSKLLQISQYGPRFMPFNSVLTSSTMTINQSTFNQPTNQYFDALMHFNNKPEEMGFDLSAAPSFMDTYQNYNDYAGTQQYGSSLNALGQIGECSRIAEPRGGFPMQIIGNDPDATQCFVFFETREPIFISPLTWGHHNHKAFIGVSNMNFQFLFDNNIQRVWSMNNDSSQITNLAVAVTVVDNPVLEFVYITPKATQKIERLQRYPFNNLQMVNQDFVAALPSGTSQKYTLNTQTLLGVPARIYIFARRRNADRTFLTTDTFFRITAIDMTFDNHQGVLAQASGQQLYEISAQNGLTQSWSDWHSYQGSILCIDCSKDIPLNVFNACGSLKNIQFQFQLTIENINLTEDIVPSIYTIISYDGLFTIDATGLTVQETNIVSPADVVDSRAVQRLPYHALNTYATSKYGGNMGNIPEFVKNLGSKAKAIYDIVPENLRGDIGNFALGIAKGVAPGFVSALEKIAPAAADIIHSLVGKGYNEDQIYDVLLGMGHIKTKPKSKAKKVIKHSGGRKLTKADLKMLQY